MKKLLSVLLAAAMLLTLLPCMLVSAAGDSYLDNSVEVWGFDGMSPHQVTTNNWTWDTEGFFEGVGNQYMNAEITADGGLNNSQALKITMLQENADPDNRFVCFMASGDSTNVANWSGAEQLMFYVDASAFGTGGTALLRLRFTDEDSNAYGLCNGKAYYRLAAGSTEWQTATTDNVGITFDSAFKGWIRIPLSDGFWGPAYSGSTKDNATTPDFSRNIGLLWMQLSGGASNAAFVNKSVLIDAFSVTTQGTGLPTFHISCAFGDGMVLQAGKPVSIYGFGKAGQELSVSLKKDGGSTVFTKTVTVGTDGRWSVLSDTPVSASYDTYTVTVSQGDKEQTLTDVLFGEVWVAGGQSNMEWLLSKDMDVATIKAKARNSNVRVIQVSGWNTSAALKEPEGAWKIADSWANIENCSAIGYYFAEQLQETLNVPVGLISTAAGGTPLAAWLSPEILETHTDFEALLTSRNYVVNSNDWGSRSSQYNARIAPFKGMQASGIIWYQGCNESGAYDDSILQLGLPVLYECWNGIFNNTTDNLAFYSVQLTPYQSSDLRRSQTDIAMDKGVQAINEQTGLALSVPTYDISVDWEANGTPGSNFDPIHPRTKKPVAERLAAAALGNYYGRSTVYSGPVVSSCEYAADGTVTLTYTNVGSGLKPVSGTQIKGFMLGKEGGKLVAASAQLIGTDKLKLTPSESFGETATKVAYAYGDTMRTSNLCNSAGFMALTYYNTTEEEEPVIIIPGTFERKRVMNFDALSGDMMESGAATTDYGSTAIGAEAVANKGYEGSVAVAYHHNTYDASTYWSDSIILCTNEIEGAVTNWSGAGMLWFWVDTRELVGSVGLDVWINGEKPPMGTPLYTYDGSKIRPSGSMYDAWDKTGRIALPNDFTGFIGFPLNAYNVNLSAVEHIYLYMEGESFKTTLPQTLYLDEFWVTNLNEAPDVTGTPIVKEPFAKEFWNIDSIARGFDNSSIHTHYNDALSAGNADAVVENGKGYDGSYGFGYVFEGTFTKEFGDNNLNFTSLSGIGMDTDWTKADYLWFWIDASDYSESFKLRFNLDWKGPAIGTPWYTWDGEGEMVEAGQTVEAWGKADFGAYEIPAGYTGFVAISLVGYSGVYFENVGSIVLHIDASESQMATLPKTVWFDEFWVTAEGSYPILTDAPKDPCEGYTDINRKLWYHTAADYVIENGYMGSTKTDSLTFEPNTKVSRAMVASIMYRIAGSPATEYKASFTDVKSGKWFTTAIEWAAQNGLASGKGDGKFDPNGNVTRQELAVFMKKLAEYLGRDVTASADISSFPDAKTVPSWAKSYVQWAVAAGLISGKTSGGVTKLAPVDNATRAEFASIIMRFMTAV